MSVIERDQGVAGHQPVQGSRLKVQRSAFRIASSTRRRAVRMVTAFCRESKRSSSTLSRARLVPNCRCHDQERLFGEEVWEAFKGARADIRDAGKALAADCNTAAVFHAMRAVEWGLRALATHLGVRRLKSYRKSGSPKLTPVAYAQWENILNSLPARVQRRLRKLRPGPRKQEREQFYNECIEEKNAIKQAWRNHIMHSREHVIREDAIAIIAHAKRLMGKLATRVSEV
ncbi:MAG: hypothetical protein ABIX28_11410 [Vicinamibacterales bacterium]